MSNSTTYDYIYAVSENGTDILGSNAAAGTPVEITGSGSELGAGDAFEVSGANGPLDGIYRFVSVAESSTGGAGFIAKDAGGHSYFFSQGAVSGGGSPLTLDPGTIPLCFLAGTLIRTPEGDVAVETLAIGDLVSTSDGREVPVRWIGRQTMVRTFADPSHLPIRVRAHAIGEECPARDLLVSPNHALMIDGILVQAGCLVNGTSVLKEPAPAPKFVYYHVEVEDHALILAENTPAETFLDNADRGRFDNWDEHERLYGCDGSMAELPLPRVKAFRQVPVGLRARLDARGDSLYGQRTIAA